MPPLSAEPLQAGTYFPRKMHFFVSVPTLGRAEAAPVETWVSCREWFSLGMVLPGNGFPWTSVGLGAFKQLFYVLCCPFI